MSEIKSATSPIVDFKTIERLRDDIDKQAEAWKPLANGKLKDVVAKQTKLNEAFGVELKRLQGEFLHFKIHTLALIGSRSEDNFADERSSSLKCISNPFSLYAASS